MDLRERGSSPPSFSASDVERFLNLSPTTAGDEIQSAPNQGQPAEAPPQADLNPDQASSSSKLTISEKKHREIEGMRNLIVGNLQKYLQSYGDQIREEFPGARNEIGTSPFIDNFIKEFLRGYIPEDVNFHLTQLRDVHN